MYTAVVLSSESIKLILETFCDEFRSLHDFQLQTDNGDPLIHHVTVNMGNFDPILNDKSLLGEEIIMEIVSFAHDKKVAAFGVKAELSGSGSKFGTPSIYSTNTIPHVTVAINPKEGGKPFLSNKLTNWNPTYKNIEIRGVLQEV